MPTDQQNMNQYSSNQAPVPTRIIKQSFFGKLKQFISNFLASTRNKVIAGAAGAVVLVLIIVLIVSSLNRPVQNLTPSEVTITFWTRDMDDEVMASIIKDFETENPYIKVKHQEQSQTDYKNRMVTRLNLKSTNIGNIVEIDESWVDEVGLNVAPVLDQTILGRYSIASIKNNSIDGYAYAIPFQTDGLVLAYNKAHLAEIKFTEEDFNKLDWTYLSNTARSLTKTKKVPLATDKTKQFDQITRSGAAIGSPRSVTNASQILQLLLIQNDAKIYDLFDGQFVLNEKFLEVMKLYTEFAIENVWADYMINDLEAFANGTASIALIRSKDIDKIKKINPALNFGTSIPAKIGGIRNISLGKSLVVPNYMPDYAASLTFLEFLSRHETGMKLFNSKGPNTFVPASTTSLNQIPNDSPFAVFSDINTTAEKFYLPNYEELTQIINQYLIKIYDDYASRSGNGTKQPISTDPGVLEQELNRYLQTKSL